MSHIVSVYARVVQRHCLELGISEEALFAGTGLTPEQLALQSLIPVAPFVGLLDRAQQLTGDRSLGLLLGRYNTPAALGQTGLAMTMAPGIREGLQAVEQFSRLQAAYIQVELVSGLELLSIRFHMLDPIGDAERLHLEATAMLIQSYVEMVSGERLEDAEFRMSFERPEYAHKYLDYLHSPVTHGWDSASVELPLHWLERRSPFYQAELWQQAQLQLGQQLREAGRREEASFTRHVRALLQSCEPPLPTLSALANRLHMSPRTLNRRLHAEQASFRDLRASENNRWACRYLESTDLSVDAIAVQLGYREASNFRRAFRYANDCTPSRYRSTSAVAKGR